MKKENIYPAYVSRNYSSGEKQVILLMIPNGEGWHYLAVKKIISIIKNNILTCLHSFRIKNKLESH